MSSPGASTTADASTLGTLTVTALNVGMIEENCFKRYQGVLRARLAGIIMKWLEGPGAAAVALNEIHSTIAEKLLRELQMRAPAMNIEKATSFADSLLWRALSSLLTPPCSVYLVLTCLPCLPALPRAGASTPSELPPMVSPGGRTCTQCTQYAHNKRTHTCTQHWMR